jgi:hypothetical protein
MASEVESEAVDSINTSESKNTRGRSAFSIWEYTRQVGSNEPVRNKKARLLFYCKYCMESYAVQLTSNF